MSPERAVLILFVILAVVALMLVVAVAVGRRLAAVSRGLEIPEDDGETM